MKDMEMFNPQWKWKGAPFSPFFSRLSNFRFLRILGTFSGVYLSQLPR